MKISSKLIFLLGLALIVAIATYFGYPYIRGKYEAKQQEDLITRLTTFKIMSDTIDQTSADYYYNSFNKAKDIFLSKLGQVEVFWVVIEMGNYKQAVYDYKGAEEAYLYAHNLQPNSYVANGNLAYLYQYYLEDYQKAEEYYLKALEPGDVMNRYLYLNGLYELYRYRLKDTAKTIAVLEQAMAELPDDINVFIMAAEYYAQTGDSDKALEFYNQALEINPQSIVVKDALEKLAQ